MNTLFVSETDLHAYVDGALPEIRRAEIAEWLEQHPESAEQVRAYQAQKRALRQLFDPILDEPLPDPLRQLSQPQVVPARSPAKSFLPFWSLQRIAAGIVLTIVSGAAGWIAHGQYQPPPKVAQAVPLSHQAAVAHAVFTPDVKRPVEISAEHQDQLIAWLSKRLGTAVRPPHLGKQGYELIGGRLLPGNSGPVAQFMYQDASGQRLTLYVSTENSSNRDTAFRFAQEGRVNVFYWVDGKFGYALSAGIGKDELARVATAVYDQFENK